MAPPSRRLFTSLLTALGGVVAAHAADYLLVFPDGTRRADELHATGHAYWATAVVIGVVGGVVALAAAVVRGGRRGCGLDSRPGGTVADRRHLVLLAIVQVALFSVIEVGERAAAGAPLAGLAGRPEFLVGVVLQLLTVIVALRMLGGAELAAEAVTLWLVGRRRRVPPRSVVWLTGHQLVPVHGLAQSPVNSRGPPRLVR